MTGAPLITPRGESGFLFTFQDVTELKKRDREARVQQRLAAVGEMAAGIAHEIRNPLASMAGQSDPARRAGADRRSVAADGHRAARVGSAERHDPQFPGVRASRSGGRWRDLDVAADPQRHGAPARRTARRVTAAHRSSSTCRPEPVISRADEAQIRQIVWNLATNGLRAMPIGGQLRLARGDGRRRGRTQGNGPRLHDEGVGIAPEEHGRDLPAVPRRLASGTGLGLSIVHRIASDYGGEVRVASEKGKGTSVEVALPIGKPKPRTVGGRRGPAEGRLTWQSP